MMTNRMRLLGLFLIVGLSGLSIAAAKEPVKKRTVVPKTILVLPQNDAVKATWAVPNDLFDLNDWRSFPFCLDGDGDVWLLKPQKLLTCPAKMSVLESDRTIDDFIWVKNGGLWIVSGDQLCVLKGSAKSKSDEIRTFRPIMRLPVEAGALSSAGADSFYLWGKNSKTGRFDVYLLDRIESGSAQSPRIHVLFTTDQTITAVGGDGTRSYVALGSLVVQLAKNDNGKAKMRGVLQQATAKVTGLAVQPGVDLLFYSTDDGVGFVDPAHRRQLEFVHSPGVGIAAGRDGLFVKLSEASGVVKITGLSRFIAEGQTYSKTSEKSGHKSKHKNAK